MGSGVGHGMRAHTQHRRFALETLAILPTWQCDVVCHHCVFSSSPSLKGRLPLDDACAAINDMASLTDAKRVTVSGGESFLDLEYLQALAQTSKATGLAFRVVTNASFATSLQLAEQAIGTIEKIGLEALAISWDQFHARFIDPERIRNAIRACRTLGVSVRLTAVVSKSSGLDAALHPLGDDAFEIPVTQVKCLPVGRAEKKIRPETLLSPGRTDMRRACRSDFDTLSLTPDGNVFPCCAVGGFTDGIRLGRYPDESIQALLARRDQDLRWVILAAQGPHYFVQRLTDNEKGELGIGEEQLHDCVTCYRLFRTPNGAKIADRVVSRLKEQARSIWRDASVDNNGISASR